MNDYCKCGHSADVHDDAGKCWSPFGGTDFEFPEPCRCKKFEVPKS